MTELRSGDALVVVDVQRDFCPGGALAIEEGDRVVPVLNGWIQRFGEAGLPVYASRDWHPRRHLSFQAEGGPWPEHCVQDTPGAAFHPDLELPGDVVVVSKGTRFDQEQYSAFHETGFAEQLRKDEVRRIFVGGLAEDVCVQQTVLDGRKEGFEVVLIPDATRPVTAEGGAAARREMAEAGAAVLEAA